MTQTLAPSRLKVEKDCPRMGEVPEDQSAKREMDLHPDVERMPVAMQDTPQNYQGRRIRVPACSELVIKGRRSNL